MFKKIILVLLPFLFTACATPPHQSVPLVWKPTSHVGAFSTSGLAGVLVTMGPFKDVRQNPSEIGRNLEEVSKIKTVSTRDEVGAWCSGHMAEVLSQYGLPIGKSGGTRLTGEVTDFYVDEDETYRARVTIRLKASTPSGKLLWEGNLSGSATRFGRSYSLENYYETLSDALIDGVDRLLRQTDFLQALKSGAR